MAGVSSLVLVILALLLGQISGKREFPSSIDRPAVAEGRVVRRLAPANCPAKQPRPFADPNRIRRLLQVGRTYAIRIKGGFTSPATWIDYHGNARKVQVAHAFETTVHRTIESNDGHRIVELRHFGPVWAVTLLCETEDLALRLGPPGKPLLAALLAHEPHLGTRRVAPEPVAEAILATGARAIAADPASKAFWECDSLSGKTVRITYVDGVGVEAIQPVGCDLTSSDCAFLFFAPVLCDGEVFRDVKSNPGDTWSIDASQLLGLMPPPMREIPKGEIVIERSRDDPQSGTHYVSLRIQNEGQARCAGSAFAPRGSFQYNVRDDLLATATLNWPASRNFLTELFLPEEHLFPEVVLGTEPPLTLRYCCKIVPPMVAGAPGGQQGSEAAPVASASRSAERRSVFGSPAPVSVVFSSIVSCGKRWLAWRGKWDVIAGVLIILALSAVLFRCGTTIACHLPRAVSRGIAAAAVAAVVGFAATVHGTLLLAQVVPFSNVIVLGNWLPLGAAFLAGIVGGERSVPPWRRTVFGAILISLGWYTVLCHFLAPPAPSGSQFQNGISLQTSPVSCSPCCAVTLLGCYGIEASEREMTELCLTSNNGTSLLGLYRGLKLKTRDTKWDVAIVRGSMEELCRADACPMIVSMRLEGETAWSCGRDGTAPTWLPEAQHTIVVFGLTRAGRVRVGDPCYGYTKWLLDDLKSRWSGEGLRLVERPRSSPDGP